MGKDLTGMIEEINGTSATLSKTNNADEPVSLLVNQPVPRVRPTLTYDQISQIVRVLNSHLYQLQLIDRGTNELQEKVTATRKSGQGLASSLGYGYGGPGVSNGSVADDFYRSYMGRR